MLYPITFDSIVKERIWGGRLLETRFGKKLPNENPHGESWEITDREEGVSVINNGPLAGRSLRDLMQDHPGELLGKARPHKGQFPLLIKILDAREKLSLQVHPPASLAEQMGGEPKTEMWYVADTQPGADLFVGLKKGTTREEFESRIKDGSVEECFHRIEPGKGESMLLESGRVHALGGGNLIFEIQQNSDTTYRVFDWNRVGLDGKPRELHLEQAMASIDFNDFEPPMQLSLDKAPSGVARALITRHELFDVESVLLNKDAEIEAEPHCCQVIAVTEGSVECRWQDFRVKRVAGEFVLLPACLEGVTIKADADSHILVSIPH